MVCALCGLRMSLNKISKYEYELGAGHFVLRGGSHLWAGDRAYDRGWRTFVPSEPRTDERGRGVPCGEGSFARWTICAGNLLRAARLRGSAGGHARIVVRSAVIGAAVMLMVIVAWRFYEGSRMGRIELVAEGEPMVGQVLARGFGCRDW